MAAEVLLINPPAFARVDFFQEKGSRGQPLGIAYLAAALKAAKISVGILDAEALNLSADQVVSYVVKTKPAIIGFTAVTPNFFQVAKIAGKIKKIKKPPKIILGGPHISALPQSLQQFPCFDFAVIGEGEITMVELVKKINHSPSELNQIKGIAFPKGEKLILTPPRPFLKNLDQIPFPAFDLLPPLSVYRPTPGMYQNLPMACLITSRGCPFSCVFCNKQIFGNLYRSRSPKNVVDEMEILLKKYGAREIKIQDDTFNLDQERVIAICQEILKRKLHFSWSCLARADFVSEPLLLLMKKAGCWQIAYGIESGNQEILNKTGKNLDLKSVKKAIAMTNAAGIEVRGFFMFGLPGETEKTMRETIDFAKKINLSSVNFFVTVPFPGTKLREEGTKWGKISEKSFKNYFYQTSFSPPFIPRGLSSSIIKKYRELAYQEFYLRPSYLISQIAKIKTFSQFKTSGYTFFSLIKSAM